MFPPSLLASSGQGNSLDLGSTSSAESRAGGSWVKTTYNEVAKSPLTTLIQGATLVGTLLTIASALKSYRGGK